ncbi:MAG: hypothetical protein NTW21_26770 [Verrucomicrobia bacterium]|nr:hypothetical protein [Verrucomicrobiota bacterium]
MWLAVVLSATSVPAVQISGLFGDHMVLQRDKPIGVWGSGEAGESIQVKLAANSASAITNADPWYFGQMVHQETGIPIGIIKTNWGGALPEHWMSPDSMKEVPELAALHAEFSHQLKVYEENLPRNMQLLEDWVRAANEAKSKGLEIPSIPLAGNLSPIWAPPDYVGCFSMYNGMISYLTRLPIKGVTWYQGESSQLDGPLYYYKMLALINGWRKVWNDPDMPFYFVQLPNPSGASGLPEFNPIGIWYFREAQAKCLRIPHTGMAVTIDVGEEDLHPRNKYDIGRRLARIALAKDYGKNIEIFTFKPRTNHYFL